MKAFCSTTKMRSEERRVGKEWRNTRWTGDWSSDVCSSDLLSSRERGIGVRSGGEVVSLAAKIGATHQIVIEQILRSIAQHDTTLLQHVATVSHIERHEGVLLDDENEIGRASCRERVEKYEVDG